jgi:hypothetical protein
VKAPPNHWLQAIRAANPGAQPDQANERQRYTGNQNVQADSLIEREQAISDNQLAEATDDKA